MIDICSLWLFPQVNAFLTFKQVNTIICDQISSKNPESLNELIYIHGWVSNGDMLFLFWDSIHQLNDFYKGLVFFDIFVGPEKRFQILLPRQPMLFIEVFLFPLFLCAKNRQQQQFMHRKLEWTYRI